MQFGVTKPMSMVTVVSCGLKPCEMTYYYFRNGGNKCTSNFVLLFAHWNWVVLSPSFSETSTLVRSLWFSIRTCGPALYWVTMLWMLYYLRSLTVASCARYECYSYRSVSIPLVDGIEICSPQGSRKNP